MVLMYFLGQLQSCLLQPDMDVSVMKFSCCVENIAFIVVSVSMAEQIFTYEGIKSSDDCAYLGKFATPHGKTYLSHEWRKYISHVGKEFPSGASEFKQRLMKYVVEGFQSHLSDLNKYKRSCCANYYYFIIVKVLLLKKRKLSYLLSFRSWVSFTIRSYKFQ
ncbi:hypothetical protein D8674_035166 [Pyrus ussuriensis x Pyrus communis]|uniref:Uncharacterized protein n=1 Tax=Pyrus ussuriensis x Pyrus communis TaxID=2448454 RepID=A0A5N5GHK7_9ROSA|nr:hypothetical protein D8674_035166 [Pyrus ussuriensis x Pyrus communis]